MTHATMSSESLLFEERVLTSPHDNRPLPYDIRCRDHEEKKPLVLFLHGFKNFKDWGPFNLIANRFATEGFVFAKLSFSHCGTTPEITDRITDLDAFAHDNMTIQMDDLDVLINALFSPVQNPLYDHCDLSRFYLVGHSRGGSLAILTAREHIDKVSALATWAAVADFSELWDPLSLFIWRTRQVFYEWDQYGEQYLPIKYQIAEDYFAHEERLFVPRALQEVKAPMLVVHSRDDSVVPASMAQEIALYHPNSEGCLLLDGGHSFGMEHPWRQAQLAPLTRQVVQRTMNFFSRCS